jgi:hypothetical protein
MLTDPMSAYFVPLEHLYLGHIKTALAKDMRLRGQSGPFWAGPDHGDGSQPPSSPILLTRMFHPSTLMTSLNFSI